MDTFIQGILDPAVMGGIKNYEEAFFREEYELNHPDDQILLQRLKDLIADQMPLLELCLQIHKERCPNNLLPLQKKMEDCFVKMQENVFEKYGKRTCDIKLENQVTMRRHYSIANDARLSEISAGIDNIGGRSRVSSLTRSQVASLKNFTANFNFTASPSVNRRTQQSSANNRNPSYA